MNDTRAFSFRVIGFATALLHYCTTALSTLNLGLDLLGEGIATSIQKAIRDLISDLLHLACYM